MSMELLQIYCSLDRLHKGLNTSARIEMKTCAKCLLRFQSCSPNIALTVTVSYEGITTILLADCYSCGELRPE